MKKPNTKTVRLILSDKVINLEGNPEELASKINGLALLEKLGLETNPSLGAKIIKFPLRGIYAHPSNPNWGTK